MRGFALHHLNRALCLFLRHSAPLYGTLLDSDGFLNVDALLKTTQFEKWKLEDLQAVVARYPHNLELVERKTPQGSTTRLIRARRGHSIQGLHVQHVQLVRAEEIQHETLMYCTTATNWKRIRRASAVKSRGQADRYIVFEREPLVEYCVTLTLNVEKAIQAAFPFFRTSDSRIATTGNSMGVIPLSYFSERKLQGDNVNITPRRSRRRGPETTTEVDGQSTLGLNAAQWLTAFVSMPQTQLFCFGAHDFIDATLDARLPGSPSFDQTRATTGGWLSTDVDYAQEDPATTLANDDSDVEITIAPECSIGYPGRDPNSQHSRLGPMIKLDEHGPRHNSAETQPGDPLKTHGPGGHWLVLPVSIPGCGKTGVCAALAHLFKFEHVQVGDFPRPAIGDVTVASTNFVSGVASFLPGSGVVLADRNNHLRKHRDELRSACDAALPSGSVMKLALRWSLRRPSMQAVYDCCYSRILSWRRGQQWYTPRAGTSLQTVLWQFLNEAQPLCEDEVDAVVDMDPFENLEDSLKRAVSGVVEHLGLDVPTEDAMAEAIQAARTYHPKMRA